MGMFDFIWFGLNISISFGLNGLNRDVVVVAFRSMVPGKIPEAKLKRPWAKTSGFKSNYFGLQMKTFKSNNSTYPSNK